MNPADHSPTAFYSWILAVCVVGWLVTTYLLLDADITMRWARNQYEIHQETALQISSLIWAPVFALSAGVGALIRYVRSRRNAV